MSQRLIIFDCDGTLVDSQHLIVAAMNQAFENQNLEPPGRDAILAIVGLSLPVAFNHLTQGENDDVISSLTNAYSQAFGELRKNPELEEPMYEGAHDAILRLTENEDILLGIATGKSRRGVDRMLKRFDLVPYFVTIQTADVAQSKPHPDMIERARAETGCHAEQTVMLGDTTFDMEMARNAGVKGIGVSWGYHPVNELERVGVHNIANDFGQLMHMLDALHVSQSAAE